jgi:hypothetical protein
MDDDSLYIYDGSDWVKSVSASQPNGLWKTGSTTVSNQATLDVLSCFSSDYQHYRVMVSVISATGTNLRFRFFSGVDTLESGSVYDRFGFTWTTSATNQVSADQNQLYLGSIGSTANFRFTSAIDVFNPNTTVHTNVMPYSWFSDTGAVAFMTGRIETTTQYTGLRLYCDSGNISGTVRVYGYRD